MTLSALGWTDALTGAFQPHSAAGLVPARVALEHKGACEVLTADGPFAAVTTGRLRHESAARADLPAVGDWVAVRLRSGERQADIHAVLPRRTTFSRRAAGARVEEQIVAANIDTVFLVTALDQNFNLRRIERYLAVAWESGAQPVVVLNKSDLRSDAAAARDAVAGIAPGVPVVMVSATHDAALAALDPWLVPAHTIAFLGSSGVGKSTLINRLLGTDRQRTAAISGHVGKGRHTTTHRELQPTPSGVLVIDTPGMRELQLWDLDDTALATTYADLAALAARCRFSDCSHRAEPGCAIQAALTDGTLDFDRWQSFQKLQREQAYAARRSDPRLARELKQSWKKLHHQARAITRLKREGDPVAE